MCVVTVRFVDIGGIVYHRGVKHNFIGYMHVIFNYDIQYSWKVCFWCLTSLSTIFQLYRGGLLKGYKKGNWIYHLEINVIDIFDISKGYNSKKLNFESRS